MNKNTANRNPQCKSAQQIAEELAKVPLVSALSTPLLDILALLDNHTQVINQHAKVNVENFNKLQASLRAEFAKVCPQPIKQTLEEFDELINTAVTEEPKPKFKLVTIDFMGVPTQAWVPAEVANEVVDTDEDMPVFIETQAHTMFRNKLRRVFVQEIPEDAAYH